MLKFAANLTLLFTEIPFVERFPAARAAGFCYVECQFPYAEVTPRQLCGLLQAQQLELVLFNLPAGDWATGERGIACHPARVEEFRAGVRLAIDYALASGCHQLNCLAGLLPNGVTQAEAEHTLVDNLRFAARALQKENLTLLLEPINSFDLPTFLINTSAAAIDVIERVGAPNLKLQYDLYHMARMGDDLPLTLEKLAHRIGHIQFADVPGRHEPGSGNLPFAELFAQLTASGYPGWVSAEYLPTRTTQESLAWFNTRAS